MPWQYEIKNDNGLFAVLSPLGAALVSLKIPDRNGRLDDIVLGFDTLEAYQSHTAYFGATVGRYANRIKYGRFTLDSKDYQLPINQSPNHLHGGITGFDKQFWEVENASSSSITYKLHSSDGDEGYPGALDVSVTYTLNADNQLIIDYSATTDQTTIINLTHHSYFNLNGHAAPTALDHELELAATRYLPTDASMIPLGELLNVEDTPFDFRNAKSIYAAIEADHPQLALAGGFDHTMVLDSWSPDILFKAATLYAPKTGRAMTLYTDQPGLQFYSGNNIAGQPTGKDGITYGKHGGICLEPQYFPNSPNEPSFPSTTLRPGEAFKSRTVFKFDVQ